MVMPVAIPVFMPPPNAMPVDFTPATSRLTQASSLMLR